MSYKDLFANDDSRSKRNNVGLFNFYRDKSGGLSIFAAIGTLVMTLASGMAIDFLRLESARQDLQDYTDSVALTAVKLDNFGEANAYSKETIINGPSDQYTVKNVGFSRSTKSQNRVDLVTVSADVKTTFLGITGIKTMSFDVNSKVIAPMSKPGRVMLRPVGAKGLWNKVINVYGESSAGRTLLFTFQYDINIAGKSDFISLDNLVPQTFEEADISDYDDVVVEMMIGDLNDPDYAVAQSVINAYGDDAAYDTSEPGRYEQIFINGKMLNAPQRLTISEISQCNHINTLGFEDSPLKKDWTSTDFELEIELSDCTLLNPSTVYLAE